MKLTKNEYNIIAQEVVSFSGQTFSSPKEAYEYISEMLDRVLKAGIEKGYKKGERYGRNYENTMRKFRINNKKKEDYYGGFARKKTVKKLGEDKEFQSHFNP